MTKNIFKELLDAKDAAERAGVEAYNDGFVVLYQEKLKEAAELNDRIEALKRGGKYDN